MKSWRNVCKVVTTFLCHICCILLIVVYLEQWSIYKLSLDILWVSWWNRCFDWSLVNIHWGGKFWPGWRLFFLSLLLRRRNKAREFWQGIFGGGSQCVKPAKEPTKKWCGFLKYNAKLTWSPEGIQYISSWWIKKKERSLWQQHKRN